MIPKFSIRQLLWAMVALGLLSLCMSSAARGSRVAFAVSVALIGMVIPFCACAIVHWISFGLAWIPAMMSGNNTALDGVLPSNVPATPSDSSDLATDLNSQNTSHREPDTSPNLETEDDA